MWGCDAARSGIDCFSAKASSMNNKANIISTAGILALFLLFLFPAQGWTYGQPPPKKQKKGSVVYVCACLKRKSCSCMAEAKTEGPCACGTEGGPPMKEVPADSHWAKQNRDALAH
jgi:hypothetical protein